MIGTADELLYESEDKNEAEDDSPVSFLYPYYDETARFVCEDFRRQGHVSDMLRDLNWKTLEDRRTISRLTLLYKSVHNIVAINIDEDYTNHEKKYCKHKNILNFLYSSNCQKELLQVLFYSY